MGRFKKPLRPGTRKYKADDPESSIRDYQNGKIYKCCTPIWNKWNHFDQPRKGYKCKKVLNYGLLICSSPDRKIT